MTSLKDKVNAGIRDIAVKNYDLRFPIGKGSFGTVYFTTDPDCRYLATKVGFRIVDGDYSDRTEADYLRKLTRDGSASRYVPEFKEFFIRDNSSFLVMEYVAGTSLKKFIQTTRGNVEPGILISLFTQLINGLTAIHSANIAHRDIKPDNIMITPDHRIKYVDYS